MNEIRKENIYKAPLQLAVEQENLDVVKLLLEKPDIDPNIKSISSY